ncbi:MAG TPA: hypothetical protein VJQ25_11740, partial [Nitrospira sp.]|nr:hypothetical protein [Nitrospira sp.]
PWRPENSDFYDPLWFGQQMAEFIAIQPLIIYCLPPKTEVLKNVALEETDNSRIMEFAGKLYDAYVARASADLWLMEAVIYDYTTDTPDGWISSWLNVQLKRRERARQSSAN